MKSSVVSSIAFMCLVQLSVGQVISTGRCPNHPVVTNFDVASYLGDWYEVARYENLFQRNGECAKASYGLNDDGSVRVFNTMVVPPNTDRDSIEGKAVVSFPDAIPLEAKLNVTFAPTSNTRSNYWVLDTDYKNIAVVWACSSLGPIVKGEYAWVLSRTPALDGPSTDRVKKTIDRYLNADKLRHTIQSTLVCGSDN